MNIPHIGANYLALADFTHQQVIKLEFIKNLPQRGLYEHQQRRIQLMDGIDPAPHDLNPRPRARARLLW